MVGGSGGNGSGLCVDLGGEMKVDGNVYSIFVYYPTASDFKIK